LIFGGSAQAVITSILNSKFDWSQGGYAHCRMQRLALIMRHFVLFAFRFDCSRFFSRSKSTAALATIANEVR